jgi:hypothetical protein
VKANTGSPSKVPALQERDTKSEPPSAVASTASPSAAAASAAAGDVEAADSKWLAARAAHTARQMRWEALDSAVRPTTATATQTRRQPVLLRYHRPPSALTSSAAATTSAPAATATSLLTQSGATASAAAHVADVGSGGVEERFTFLDDSGQLHADELVVMFGTCSLPPSACVVGLGGAPKPY